MKNCEFSAVDTVQERGRREARADFISTVETPRRLGFTQRRQVAKCPDGKAKRGKLRSEDGVPRRNCMAQPCISPSSRCHSCVTSVYFRTPQFKSDSRSRSPARRCRYCLRALMRETFYSTLPTSGRNTHASLGQVPLISASHSVMSRSPDGR